MNPIIDFINANRDRYLTELKKYLAIPSISALPQHAADVRRCAEWTADELSASACRTSVDRDAGQSGRLRRVAGRAGRADDAVLRPLRRAAGRSRRAVGVAAVRGDRPRRRDLRARIGRRQGPDLHALQGHRSAPEADRETSGQHEGLLEGEEEVGSENLDDFIHENKDAAQSRRAGDLGFADVRSRHSVDLLWPARADYFQIDVRGTASDLHSGSFGGAVANPAFVLAQILSGIKDRGGRIKIPGLLRRCARAERGGAEGVRETSVQREALSQRAGRAEAVRRERLHDARARVGTADVRGERPAVRLHG